MFEIWERLILTHQVSSLTDLAKFCIEDYSIDERILLERSSDIFLILIVYV